MEEIKEPGKVYLVGAGPGDPGLLTIKAYQLLKNCDVVIYDALANSDILEFAPAHAETIFVGPPRTSRRIDQREIERIMIDRARQGLFVVRLKGGDPFMFGRGGEEAEALTRAGIRWDVVPGVSSGIAVPAYAGIPVTHRDCSSSVTFLTGHECVNKSVIEWNKICHSFNTLVIFMGATKIRKIVGQLLQSNYSPQTPIAVIESGTTVNQSVLTSTLGRISEIVARSPVHTPALIVIGEVVKYREVLRRYFVQEHFSPEKMKSDLAEIVD